MKSISILKHLCALSGAALLVSTAFGGADTKSPDPKVAAAVEPRHPMYLGSVNTGVKGNDAYVDGNFSIVAPVWSTLGADATLSGGALFLEPYISWGEGGEVATSLGLGYRYLFGDQSLDALTKHDGHQAGFFEEGIAIGGNLFLDMMDTEADNQFWQLGVGLEVTTRYVEISGNYYIPLSERQLAEETRTTETFTTSSTKLSRSVTPLNSPYAQGNSIAQDATFTTYATTTTRTTTIERLFQRFEEGMEGWDAQIGVLIPGLDRYLDVKVIGGYYSFDNQPFGPQEGGTGKVEGWKAGLEVRPVPALVLSGTWYEDKRLTGNDWTVGVQMQIPFEAGDLGDGKGFWGRIKDSFTPRRRHLIERLAEPVHRQNAAVKIANRVKTKAKASTDVERKTRVVSSAPGQLVLADDVVFVNNGEAINSIQAGSAEGTGSAEQPLDTIQAGSTLAQTNSNSTGRVWSVYTQGTVPGYSGDVIAQTGSVKFIGSGSPIAGLGGTSFGSGPAPVINGGFFASGIETFGVSGYTIVGGLSGPINPGILILGTNPVLNATLDNNTITGGIAGIAAISLPGSTINLNVSNNNISGYVGVAAVSIGDGLDEVFGEGFGEIISGIFGPGFGEDFGEFTLSGSGSAINLNVSNNYISGLIGMAAASIGESSTINMNASHNTITGEFGGILALSVGTGLEEIFGGIFGEGEGFGEGWGEGLGEGLSPTATINLTVADNVISGGYFGLAAATIGGGATTNLIASNNTISDTYLGIGAASVGPGTTTNMIVSNNTITDAYLGIAAASIGPDAYLTLTATDNVIQQVESGILLLAIYDSALGATLNGNSILGVSLDGITAMDDGGSILSINGSVNNTVTGFGGSALNSSGTATGTFFLNGVPVTLPLPP